MIIKEFQVVLPLTVEEYQIGQLYAVAEASKAETGGGDGVEVLKNEPIDHPEYNKHSRDGKCQYTHKIYHLEQKVPGWIKAFAPAGSLHLHEEAWNAYPFCKTVLTNPGYMEKGFRLSITTWHKEGDRTIDNVHELEGNNLAKRQVISIDIVNDPISSGDYKKEYDPSLFSEDQCLCLHKGKDSNGLDWIEKVKEAQVKEAQSDAEKPKSEKFPVMTCYKLVEVEFIWTLIGGKVERFIGDFERRLFTNFHRQLYCTRSEWGHMTLDDIRRIEDETKKKLDEQRQLAELKGSKAGE